MRAKEGLFLFFIELFSGIDQAADPGEPFFGCMIGVQYDWDSIVFGNIMDVQGAGNAAGDIALELVVGHSLAGDELSSAVGKLDDNRRVDFCCCFQHGIDGIGTDGIYGGQGELIVLGIFIEGFQLIAEQYPGLVFFHGAKIGHGRLIFEFAQVFLQEGQVLL